LKSILGESPNLKSFETKQWLRKKAQFYSKSSPDRQPQKAQSPPISKKYLMSEQEMKQNDIME